MVWRLKAKIDLHKLGQTATGTMNETEKTYAWILEAKKQKKEILDYKYEGFKLRLADDCWYVVDFMVYRLDGVMEVHECKGPYIREDAMIKLRCIAEQYPFPVFLCQRVKKTTQFTIKKIGR
jgi:hypothetical protein